jgi:uncharacterized RDD family membrane protein YckC
MPGGEAMSTPGQADPSGPSGMSDRSGPSGPRAGFWRRVGASLIDGLLISVVTNIVFAVTGASFAVRELLALLAVLSYFTYFEGSTGQTLGKRMLGIRVVGFDSGQTIGYQRAAIRYLASIISGLCLLIGYLWMLWDREKQTWHDKVANAVLVPVADYPVN